MRDVGGQVSAGRRCLRPWRFDTARDEPVLHDHAADDRAENQGAEHGELTDTLTGRLRGILRKLIRVHVCLLAAAGPRDSSGARLPRVHFFCDCDRRKLMMFQMSVSFNRSLNGPMMYSGPTPSRIVV